MKFHTDDYFVIGGQHVIEGKPCQDHTLSGTFDRSAYAIVSDGCSSGALTDIGARLATTSARTAIQNHWNATQKPSADAAQDIALQQRVILRSVRSTLGLSRQDMLATCMYAYVSPDGGLVHIRGDGVLAMAFKGHTYRLYKYEWQNNAPLYPAYADDEFASFTEFHGGDNALALTEHIMLFADGEWTELSPEKHTVTAGIRGITVRISKKEMKELEYIALMSDGASQVDNVEWRDAALDLAMFKNAEGAFAKRRMIRFLKESKKKGDGPIDDISIAVIRIESTEGEDDGRQSES